ncbi:hypothetical protein EDEG_01402 [Edhazardia aedis USNM 41457]|uniref:Tr-type G domain-containing protein n=1 Tax=Edhazardia aedis (strain USNM 41457) TaxID=1003232 RepID=J9D981_EDHAE|nr:hypothetical protein EDEG_01402 [Edhazardia aedis USNM 41457]|eukprot:EJW04336.1 hypothetical protein EDEG_01402 [Edhazardia aedis USNM 41457]
MEDEKNMNLNKYVTTVVAHIDHGKTTLIDSLIASQGIISKQSAGLLRYMDTREDEQTRGITLKLSTIKLLNITDIHSENILPEANLSIPSINSAVKNMNGENDLEANNVKNNLQKNIFQSKGESINTNNEEKKMSNDETIKKKSIHYIIDTPGHVDFESLVQCSTYMSDYILLIIDINEGITPRLYSIVNFIRKKKCILVLNKFDKKLNSCEELELYSIIQGIICRLNGLMREEYFEWKKNNIILACSTKCTGFNYFKFQEIVCIMSRKSPNSQESTKSAKTIEKANSEISSVHAKPIDNVNHQSTTEPENIKNDKKQSTRVADAKKQAGSLKNVTKFLYMLKRKIDNKDLDTICQKFNINRRTEKDIWMGVIPLYETVFQSIETFDSFFRHDINNSCENKHEKICEMHINSISSTNTTEIDELPEEAVLFEKKSSMVEENKISKIFDSTDLINLNPLSEKFEKLTLKSKNMEHNLAAVTGFTILKEKKTYNTDNLLFAVRILKGKIFKGQQVICKNFNSTKTLVIDQIFDTCIRSFVEKNIAFANEIVYVKADLLKHSVIYQNLEFAPNLISPSGKPFYKRYVTLGRQHSTNEFKKAIKILSFMESNLSVRINKFNDFEFLCEGKVQFEKICTDLVDMGFEFTIGEPYEIFCEIIGNNNTIYDDNDEYRLEVIIDTLNDNDKEDEDVAQIQHKTHDRKISKESVYKAFNSSINKNKNQNDDYKESLVNPLAKKTDINPKKNPIENISTTYNFYRNGNSSHENIAEKSKDIFYCENMNPQNVHVSKKNCSFNSNTISDCKTPHKDRKLNIEGNISEKYNIFTDDEKNNNSLSCFNNEFLSIIKNAYNIFITSGFLINQPIRFTKTKIFFEPKTNIENDKIFSKIKETLVKCYKGCNPTISPFYYKCSVQILTEYLGTTYTILHNYNFVLLEEIYNEETDFFVIECLIPQFLYYKFVEDIRMKTSGTVYLQVQEYGFRYNKGFDQYVFDQRKKKGLFVEEMIIEEPEKQRTHKK